MFRRCWGPSQRTTLWRTCCHGPLSPECHVLWNTLVHNGWNINSAQWPSLILTAGQCRSWTCCSLINERYKTERFGPKRHQRAKNCSETGTGSDSLVLWGCGSNHNPEIISDEAAHHQTEHRNTKSQTTDAKQKGWWDKTVDSNYNSQTALLEEVSNQIASDFSVLELEEQNMLDSDDYDIIRSCVCVCVCESWYLVLICYDAAYIKLVWPDPDLSSSWLPRLIAPVTCRSPAHLCDTCQETLSGPFFMSVYQWDLL